MVECCDLVCEVDFAEDEDISARLTFGIVESMDKTVRKHNSKM
jgi:hypothetical protein